MDTNLRDFTFDGLPIAEVSGFDLPKMSRDSNLRLLVGKSVEPTNELFCLPDREHRAIVAIRIQADGFPNVPSQAACCSACCSACCDAKRPIENGAIGISVRPVAITSAIVSPTPGLIAKPSPLKPNA